MGRGKVKWFDEERGFGFIVPDDGDKDVFVHWSGIAGTGRRNLTQGETVTFDVKQTVKGLQADNVERVGS